MSSKVTPPEAIRELFQQAADNVRKMPEMSGLLSESAQAVDMNVNCFMSGGTLYTCGNGGSAGDAQALATELMVKLRSDRGPMRAVALSTDTSVLTAIGNDFGYEYLFHRQVKALLRPNDVLLAITTSGNSPNIQHALTAARENGAKTILLTGFQGGKCAPLADLKLLAPGEFAGPIQECHIVIYHMICTLVETRMIEAGKLSYEASYGSQK